MAKLTVGSLFSGIGGLELGLEMTGGFETKWQVEIDEYATKVLAKHWPDVTRFRDIRDCGKRNLEPVDLICGGFPCQDISDAGRQAGINGKRSGLWREFHRIICELRPHFVLVENVSALLHRGIERILSDLSKIRYDAEWSTLSACAMGAPHMRERVFIVAYPRCEHEQRWIREASRTPVIGRSQISQERSKSGQVPEMGTKVTARLRENWWGTEPDVDRMAAGVPRRMDRLRGLGNAVVPQVAEYIGRCILASMESESVA